MSLFANPNSKYKFIFKSKEKEERLKKIRKNGGGYMASKRGK